MSRTRELQQLLRQWKPPAGLEHSPARNVALNSNGWALVLLALLLLAGALTAGLLLAHIAERQALEGRWLREHGVDATARVERVERVSGEKRRYRMSYRFDAGGVTVGGSMRISERRVEDLHAGAALPVRYVAFDPSIYSVNGTEHPSTPQWLAYLAAVALGLVAWIVILPVQRHWRMLAEGRVAPARVTRHEKAKEGQLFHYEFPVLGGTSGTGKSGPVKRPPAVGSLHCVLYDREQPSRNNLYPLTFVRLREP